MLFRLKLSSVCLLALGLSYQPCLQAQGNAPPVPQFTATPASGMPPLEVRLDGRTSSDSDGTIKTYMWEISDGRSFLGSTHTFTFDQEGTYTITLTVTDNEGASASRTQTVTVIQSNTCLTNLSTRAKILGSQNVAYNIIAGFILSGTGTRQIAVRGQNLEYGVDPYLQINEYPSNDPVGSNNDWQQDYRQGSLPDHLKPTDLIHATLLRDLKASAHTATLSSVNQDGLGIIEVIAVDGSCNGPVKLANLSTRANIQGGAYDIIAGFIITGSGTLNLVVRGTGLDVGVDPYLAIQPLGSAEVTAQNNDWQDDLQAKNIPAHLQPLKSTDAALLLSLEAGAYTAILSSVGKKGLGLIEVVAID